MIPKNVLAKEIASILDDQQLTQTEAAMAQKKPAPLESPQSPFDAQGERKLPVTRAAEITQANVAAKAQRFADALHQEGFTAQDVGNMKLGDFATVLPGPGLLAFSCLVVLTMFASASLGALQAHEWEEA